MGSRSQPDERRPARPPVGEQQPVGDADPAPQPVEEEAQIGVTVEDDLGPELADLADDRHERRPLLGHIGVAADRFADGRGGRRGPGDAAHDPLQLG